MTEFNEWADSIIELSGKFADEDSMKFAIATMVMHLGPQRSHVPKNHFVRSLRKTAANQVAGQVFQDIKLKQKLAEDTAKQQELSNSNGSQKETTNA